MGTALLLQQIVAGIVLVLCVLALARLLLGAPRRQKLDAGALRTWRRGSRWGRAAWQAPGRRRAAAKEAQAAIERAKRRERASDVDRDGNVVRPRAFKPPQKPH
jgi:hypothetical protein